VTTQPDRSQSALGRGLASLIPPREMAASGPVEIPLDRIRGNPYQPRQRVAQESLDALAASIAEHGVIQPVLVTETLDGYQLIAGERRVRAAQMAGLERIPAVIRQLADHSQLELALVENLQRADLDPIEEAHAYRQLIDEFGMNQEELGTRFGRARSTIANTLRLLDTDPRVQAAVGDGSITEGHARALAGLAPPQQVQLLEVVIARELSVRQTEELVRRFRDGAAATGHVRPRRETDPDLERVEEELRRSLGTKVSLARSRRGGRIVIEYYSDEELGRLYERLIGGSA
jgi:ParB family chromosome partitioning protein